MAKQNKIVVLQVAEGCDHNHPDLYAGRYTHTEKGKVALMDKPAPKSITAGALIKLLQDCPADAEVCLGYPSDYIPVFKEDCVTILEVE